MDRKPMIGERVRITGRVWTGQRGEVIEDLALRPGRSEETARVRLLRRSEALTFPLDDVEEDAAAP